MAVNTAEDAPLETGLFYAPSGRLCATIVELRDGLVWYYLPDCFSEAPIMMAEEKFRAWTSRW